MSKVIADLKEIAKMISLSNHPLEIKTSSLNDCLLILCEPARSPTL